MTDALTLKFSALSKKEVWTSLPLQTRAAIRAKVAGMDPRAALLLFSDDDEETVASLQAFQEVPEGLGRSNAMLKTLTEVREIGLVVRDIQKKQMDDTSSSASVSNISSNLISKVMNTLGLSIRLVHESYLNSKKEKSVDAFIWDDSAENSDLNQSNYKRWLQNIKLPRQHVWYTTSKVSDLLSVSRGDHFPFTLRGTCDMAVCLRQAVTSQIPNVGLRIVFELKKMVGREDIRQTIIELILANIHCVYLKPWAVLTDLNDHWSIIFLKESDIIVWHSSSRAQAIGVIEEFLQNECLDHMNEPQCPSDISGLEPLYKRRRLELKTASTTSSALEELPQQHNGGEDIPVTTAERMIMSMVTSLLRGGSCMVSPWQGDARAALCQLSYSADSRGSVVVACQVASSVVDNLISKPSNAKGIINPWDHGESNLGGQAQLKHDRPTHYVWEDFISYIGTLVCTTFSEGRFAEKGW